MGIFRTAFLGGFFGKIFATIFIAICFALGIGPDQWAEFMIQGLPNWITPGIARGIFLVLGVITLIYLFLLFRNKKSVHNSGLEKPLKHQWNLENFIKRCKENDPTFSALSRKPEIFFKQWLAALNQLRNERNVFDLNALFQVWGRILVGMTAEDLMNEATYILNCLERNGYLSITDNQERKRYWGRVFDNKTIKFSDKWDEIW